ncbi:hypothetical protein F53441_9356 [Fusarium austroafricanum]|uniref:Uncharacterized protein n=1 Tax=Fusarium austroafricanum TaxID=2364996 RepID=A0A8H4KAV1_9HYPO|nr:hypothetical protein F53441_9356 [Fusarium austroafricanum]
MSNVQNPTYFLAPNWNFPPGGRIAIGNIIRNPLKPHLFLTKADPNNPQPTTSSLEKNWRLSVHTAAAKSLSIWGVFLDKISLKTTAQQERINNGRFTMDSLETIYLSDDPSPGQVKARCNDPLVKDFMRLDSIFCSPVYMVTGIKVAKGFKLEGEKSSSTSLEMEGSGEVSQEVSLGAGAKMAKLDKVADEFESAGDIVFAYQLMKIKPKGWTKEKTLETSEYQTRQSFLKDGDNIEEEAEVEVETESVTWEDLEELKSAETVDAVEGRVAFPASKRI